jgi:hypothetical protein
LAVTRENERTIAVRGSGIDPQDVGLVRLQTLSDLPARRWE